VLRIYWDEEKTPSVEAPIGDFFGLGNGEYFLYQSKPLADRAELERRVDEFSRRFAEGEVPRPPFWSGFRLVPQRIEFWQEQPYRLHDRLLFLREGIGWRRERLFP